MRYKSLAGAMVRIEGHEKTYTQSSRPWECGNPEGISKECGKGGKPASWLSTLSILCHFHGLLRIRVSQSRNHLEDTFWEQKPLVREADVSEGIAPFVEIPAELRPIPA